MILLPVGAAVWWRRRVVVPWYLFCAGAAAFVASQAYHIPLNNWLTDLGVIGPVAADAPKLLQTAVILGMSAGLSEGVARAAAIGLLRRFNKAHRWTEGVMVGLGHGGIEAMLIGGVLVAGSASSLFSLQNTDLNTLNLSPEQLTAVEQQLSFFLASPLAAVIPVIERMVAMSLHVVVTMMVWQAFARRNPLYFVVGVGYHALVDTTAVYLSALAVPGWQMELIFAAALIPGASWLWWTRDKAELAQPHRVTAVREEWRAFMTATRKELLQQWRTRRVLVIWAVFLLFGLMSPLLAKFTPQMLTMVEGAEQFADLIPQPTINDAIVQYIKNITQFGFIIAILVGMGAVAGEKERGTAALILSKPMPRWAFLLSKFVAQALLYAVAFLLAALATYYYTLVLFGPLDFVAFLLGSGLLWVWLLCYTAVALLGSAIGNSVGSGAGLGLLGAVLLLLMGALPVVGSVAPSGLVAWASQMGLGSATANAGALAASVTLIVMLLITSLAVFEEQEV
ncbi:MAG: YhfC family intramembrane metalloprotease [Chloroflexi bacterium]|nr:YhfC family intramembrane metalloprotease [Chloroflexota bacterium]MBP7043063.1 YhfC family intramembrane metalloprotease [Chloroflexota bacterium]